MVIAFNKRLQRTLWIATAGCAVFLTGCQHKQLDQAARLGTDGDGALQNVANYYGNLADNIDDYENMLVYINGDFVLVKNTPDPNDPTKMISQIDQWDYTIAQLRVRQKLALQIASLYKTLGNISANKPDDLQTAVGNFSAAVQKLNGHPLSITAENHTLPVALVTQAFNGIIADAIDLQKVQDIKKSAPLIDDVVSNFTKIYQKEKTTYVEDEGLYYAKSMVITKLTEQSGNSAAVTRLNSWMSPYGYEFSKGAGTPTPDETARVNKELDYIQTKLTAKTESDSVDISDQLDHLHMENQDLIKAFK